MKHRFAWILLACTSACGLVFYTTLRDPLADALHVSQTIESIELSNWTFTSTVESTDTSEPENSQRSTNTRFVLQGGGNGRETQFGNRRAHPRDHSSTLRAFREAIGDKWKTSVQILDENKQLALGAIIRNDGWIVTKSSEVPDHAIDVRLFDGSKAKGIVKIRRSEHDIALVKIDRDQLPAVNWSESTSVPLGGWLASADARPLPLAIGVVSVSSRNVRSERSVLGVTLGPSTEGALVEDVVEGSGADKAGITVGDTIHEIDGTVLNSREQVLTRLKGLGAGQRITLGILRNGRPVKVKAQMMDLNSALLDPTEMEVNGNISARATGFRNVLQHDTVLAPHQCGGPLIDVNGDVVGLNIARAGRVCSYAIPSKVLAPVLADMLENAEGSKIVSNTKPVETTVFKPAISDDANQTQIPNGIVIETLKPEVVLPGSSSRP